MSRHSPSQNKAIYVCLKCLESSFGTLKKRPRKRLNSGEKIASAMQKWLAISIIAKVGNDALTSNCGKSWKTIEQDRVIPSSWVSLKIGIILDHKDHAQKYKSGKKLEKAHPKLQLVLLVTIKAWRRKIFCNLCIDEEASMHKPKQLWVHQQFHG